jgi:uncharacterized protein (TIGR02266 family)
MADARKDRRTLLSLKIRYKSATLEDFIERYSMDISRGGVFIKAKKPLAVGTLLKFEFMLQDQSTLIHGVGRVVWRREAAEADANNPSGMGIKFIKMDPDSRSVVQHIVEDRGLPGAFDQGKEGVPAQPATLSEPQALGTDQTKVRHVSEFLASAFEEGGAGEAATREAQAGARRARQASNQIGAARGAFSATNEGSVGGRRSVSDSPARGAMSAFGGSSMSAGGRMQSSAAPAMDELDAEDDFLDNETTKVQELPTASEYPDAAATVVASEAPFVAEKLQTPVVPATLESNSPLEQAVPDLFGPDSFGPAPGELIDASLLDPSVATVPPKASALPRGAVPEAAAIPSEAFKVPQAPAPVGTQPPTIEKKKSRVGMIVVLFVLLLASAGVAAWQLGLADEVIAEVAPLLGLPEAPVAAPAQVERPTPTPEPAAEPEPVAEPAAVAEPTKEVKEPVEAAEAEAEAEAKTAAVDAGLVKIRVVSVPNGAFVSVNGKGAGRTPLDLEYEPGTKLSLYSKARGFLARRQQVTVDAAQPEVKLVLAPLPYVIEVVTDPAGARASAVGGGEVTTPGELKFRSMPASRKVVISKDGYTTVTKTVTRRLFVEEKSRMAASVRVTLAKDGVSVASAEPAPAPEAVKEEPEAAAPPPAEVAAPADSPEPPAPAEETPAPSEPTDVDAP